ncbi:YihY/virulence factor BrkB family protein [Murinocardiopsis flavida]|uniref:YihY/virulence factor BrkB family protein n=1 Tax=Murinocardiopsis flavida TaxID=645275 RepID=UPI001FEBA264|nr:YihY/virulence factor BrkB family protein [Murinocardiopsis flavida]
MGTLLERLIEAARQWRTRHRIPGAAATLIVRTTMSAYRTRVLGLAAESAFFALLSLPALLLGLVGTLGHLRSVLGARTVLDIRAWILDLAAKALTSNTVDTLVTPLVDDFIRGAQGGLLSVSFLVSLWSGSRAMSVFIEAITISYGLEDLRGFIWHRALAFVAYLGGLLFGLVVLPVVVAGPDLLERLLPMTAPYMHLSYWPIVGLLSLACIVVLYALSVPVHTPLWRHLPGALVAVLILMFGSVGLRVYLDASFGEVTVYGSLAAPIIILAWLYVMALAVLIGSSLNAEIDAMWPTPETASARAAIAARRHARSRRVVERHERALQNVTAADADPGDQGDDEDAPPATEPHEAEATGTRDPEEEPAAPQEPGETAPRETAPAEQAGTRAQRDGDGRAEPGDGAAPPRPDGAAEPPARRTPLPAQEPPAPPRPSGDGVRSGAEAAGRLDGQAGSQRPPAPDPGDGGGAAEPAAPPDNGRGADPHGDHGGAQTPAR